MKRIVSLVLVLVLLLSVLPGAAAETAELTMTCPTTAPLPGGMGFHFELDGVPVEDSRVTEVWFVGDGLGTVFYEEDRERFIWDTNTAYPGRSGKLMAVVDGVTYEIDVSTNETPMVAFYKGTECAVEDFLIMEEDHSFFYGNDNVPVITAKVKEEEWIISAAYDDAAIMETSISEDGKTATFIPKENLSGTWQTRLWIESSEGRWRLRITVSDEVLTDTDAFPLTEEWTREWVNESNICATPFELDGETYYMSASKTGVSFPTSINSMQPTINNEAEIFDVSFSIMFWSDMGEGNYQKITDPVLQEKIKAAFNGSLALEFYGRKGWVLAEEYPAMTRSSNWLCPIEVHLNLKNHGDWVLRASGTIGGKTVESICNYQWAPKQSKVWTPDPDADTDIWTQVQNFVTNYEPERNVMQIVQLPEGVFAGTLVIPDKRVQGNMGLSIVGVPGKTVIAGGIRTEGVSRIGIEGIVFHGANCGCEEHEFPSNTPNKAIYGNAIADVTGCTFVGYDIAARIDHTVDCVFINNDVAVLFDNYLLGNGQILYNRFIGNKTALDFEKLDSDLPTTFFRIQENQFIDNKWDVRNKLKRTLYLPGNFFGETTEDGVVSRSCNAQVKKGSVVASLMDDTPDEDNPAYAEQVYAYPRYADTSFSTYEKEEVAVVSVAQTADFRIPQDNLTGASITVMDAEEELATIVFPDSGSDVSLFGEDGSFDATVSVEEQEDGSLTFTMNDPLGLMPIVRIPCGTVSGVVASVKTNQGRLFLDTTVEDGYICFRAPMGGTYDISIGLTAKREEEDVKITVNAESGTISIAAVYDKDGKLVKAVPVALGAEEYHASWSLLEKLSLDLDLSQYTVKVMMTDGNYEPQCAALILQAE